MKKLISLVLGIMLVFVLTVGIVIVVNNNNKVAVSAAPKATVTAMPNIATAVPTNVPAAAPTTAVTTLTSLEASEKTILVDSLGYRHAMILEGDLKKVTYKEIEVDVENGIYLRLNSLGVIGVIWHREAQARDVKMVNTSHDEGSVRKFFSQNGELFTNYVREGYAELATSARLYQITGIRFVQLQGEDFFRLVVTGNGNGNDYPVVTDKPAPVPPANTEEVTSRPQHNETAAPTVTPKPTATVPPANTEEVTSRPRHNATPEPEYTAVPTPAGVTPPPAPSVDDGWDDYDW